MQDTVSKQHLRIAYLGPPASFSHQAAEEAFPPSTSASVHPLPSFKDLFSAIQNPPSNPSDAFDFAVIPVENSTNGGVVQVFDLLIQCGLDPSSCLFPDVEVVAEHYLAVHHCLYIHPSAVPPPPPSSSGTSLQDTSLISPIPRIPISTLNITALYSHPQVWGQCNIFLSTHFSPTTTERIDTPSTSAAAAFVAQNPPLPSSSTPTETPAAICSSLAGIQSDLYLLAANIEDEPGKNTTRFLIVRNARHNPSSRLPEHLAQPLPPLDPDQMPRPINHKSLLTFTIPHAVPGSLAAALAVFSKHGFNLTSITTRPSRERNWHYVFFVECGKEVRGGNSGADGGPSMLKELTRDLDAVAERTCWLGSWVDRL